LVRTLKERHADIEIDAMGGPSMARAGANVIESRDGFSVMGLTEGIGAFPAHVRALRRLQTRFASRVYDLVILVDYPGFHLRVAAAASGCGIPVLYYIAPQLWAWGSWRVRSLRRHIDLVAAVLPFEATYFRSKGVAVEFVGHPLLDRENNVNPLSARAALGLSPDAPVLGLLPGSRRSEVDRMWPTFRDAARRLLKTDPALSVIVAAVDGGEYPGAPEFEYCAMDSTNVIAAADAILCKSGTATLEAAVADTPTVVAYMMNPFTYAVARWVVRVPHVSLVNLIAEREVCPEFLQGDATPRTLAAAVEPLLQQRSEEAAEQRRAFAEVRAKMGGPGATQRVASLAEMMVG
jgi:lipid-A-disaccharide synthase